MTAAANRLTYLNMQASVPASDQASLKLDRLRELKATIDALRCEQENQDPLLQWVIAEAAKPLRE